MASYQCVELSRTLTQRGRRLASRKNWQIRHSLCLLGFPLFVFIEMVRESGVVPEYVSLCLPCETLDTFALSFFTCQCLRLDNNPRRGSSMRRSDTNVFHIFLRAWRTLSDTPLPPHSG